MNRVVVMSLPIVSMLSLMLALPAMTAADPAPTTAPVASNSATGTVAGVVMKDGKPVEGMQVRLILPARGQSPTTNPSATSGANAARHHQIVAEATTDANGKFTLSDVPAGMYRVIAGKRNEGIGMSRVSVAAGQVAEVNLTVNPANADRATRHHKNKAGK
jgi:hypothetical protein